MTVQEFKSLAVGDRIEIGSLGRGTVVEKCSRMIQIKLDTGMVMGNGWANKYDLYRIETAVRLPNTEG